MVYELHTVQRDSGTVHLEQAEHWDNARGTGTKLDAGGTADRAIGLHPCTVHRYRTPALLHIHIQFNLHILVQHKVPRRLNSKKKKSHKWALISWKSLFGQSA